MHETIENGSSYICLQKKLFAQVLLDSKVPPAPLVLVDPQEPPVSLVCVGHLARRERREHQALKDHLGQKVKARRLLVSFMGICTLNLNSI